MQQRIRIVTWRTCRQKRREFVGIYVTKWLFWSGKNFQIQQISWVIFWNDTGVISTKNMHWIAELLWWSDQISPWVYDYESMSVWNIFCWPRVRKLFYFKEKWGTYMWLIHFDECCEMLNVVVRRYRKISRFIPNMHRFWSMRSSSNVLPQCQCWFDGLHFETCAIYYWKSMRTTQYIQNGSCARLYYEIQMVYTFVDLHCIMTSSNGNIFRVNNDLLNYKAPNHNVLCLWRCTYKMLYWPLVLGIHLFTQPG